MNKEASHSQTIINLRVSLFGALTIELDGKLISPSISPSVGVLLAYLLLHPQQKHSRLVLAGLMWPDMSETRGRHALRDAIWHIKKGLPGLLQTDTSIVGISPHVHLWIDVAEFDRLLKPLIADEKPVRPSQTRNDLYQAIQLYRGDLLEGLYEDWILLERDRLYALYLRALEHVIRLEKLAGCYEQALAAAQTLSVAEPLRESVHREVMQLNYHLNRPEAALEQYAVCCQILADEISEQPEAETIRLAQEIADSNGQVVLAHLSTDVQSIAFLESSSLCQLPLIGRRSERAELTAQVAAVHKGALELILVEGEAGVGKTRLLQEVARDAGWLGAEVLWGKGKELEAGSPYGPLLEMLISGLSPLRASQIVGLLREELSGLEESGENQGNGSGMTASHEQQADATVWLQVLCSLIPTLADKLSGLQSSRPVPLEEAQEHLRLVEALSHLLLAWSHITPLVLILEDLHWADQDTLDTLIHLTEQLPVWSEYAAATWPGQPKPASSSGGILIIGSYRGEDARSQPGLWEGLRHLDRLSIHERLVLPCLDANATGELVRHSLGTGHPAPLFESRLYSETNGNPLFVLETLRYLYGEKLLWRDEKGEWNTPFDETTTDYAELPLSPVIEHIIDRRLDQLSAETRLVLNAAAVLGNRFEYSLLAAVIGLDDKVVLASLGLLIQQGFAEEHVEEYRFHHDKIRLAVYESLSNEERLHLHRRIAQVVERTQSQEVAMLAHHYTSGQLWNKAVFYHRLAAEAAQAVHTYVATARHLDVAIRLLEPAGLEEERYNLLVAREAVLDVLGEREAQAANLEAMLELAHDDVLRQAHMLCRRAKLLAQLSRFNEAEAAASEALAIARSSGDKSTEAAALMALGHTYSVQHLPKQAVPYLRQAVEICQLGDDLSQRAKAHHALAIPLSECQISEAQTEIQAALALYERLGDLRGQAGLMGTLGILCMEQGDNEGAISCHSQSLQIACQIGYRSEEARGLYNLGHIFWQKNRFVEALQHFSRAQLIFRALGNVRNEFNTHESIATIRCFILGDVDTAWDELQAAVAYYRQRGDYLHYGLVTLGDIARCRGDFKTARAYLEQSTTDSLNTGMAWLAIGLHISFIQLELDENHPAAALEHLEAVETLCQETGISGWSVKLLELRSMVLLALGCPEAAVTATSEAMKQLGPGVEQAYLIPFRHFQALSALGRTQEASPALEQAYQMLADCLTGFTPEQQKMSWEHVPEHRAILAAWQTIHPSPATVRLPRADAPIGRPLHDDEWIEVRWTVRETGDHAISNKASRRQRRILRLLNQAKEQGAAPTLEDLAAVLDASKATLKRDLVALRQAGHSVTTRGSRGDK